MNNAYYQPTYEKGLFDYSDEIYKGEALESQRGALGQRRDASKSKQFGKPSALKEAWRPYAGIYQQAIQENIQKAVKASASGDVEAHRQALQNIDEANQFAQMTQQQKALYEPISKSMQQNPSDYVNESSEDALGRDDFLSLDKKNKFTEGYEIKDGKILRNGENWYNANAFGIPSYRKSGDNIFQTLINENVLGNIAKESFIDQQRGGSKWDENIFLDKLDVYLKEANISSRLKNPETLAKLRQDALDYARLQGKQMEQEKDEGNTYRGYGWSKMPTEKERPFIDAMLNTKPDPNGNVQVDVENLKSGVKEETVTVWEEVEGKYIPVKYVYIGENGDVTVETKSGKVIGGMPARNAVNQSFGVLWQEWKPQVDKEQRKQTSENVKSKNNTTPKVGTTSDLPD